MNPLYMIPLCAACASVVFAEQEVNLEAFTSKGQMMFSDTSRGFSKAKHPAVVRFDDTHFMYYTVTPFHSNELHPIPLFTNFPPKANSQQYESRLADWHSHFINPTDASADLFHRAALYSTCSEISCNLKYSPSTSGRGRVTSSRSPVAVKSWKEDQSCKSALDWI